MSSTSSSVALVEELQARIREVDPLVNAICTPNPAALTQAAQLDTERGEGRVRGPLHGVPVLVKRLRRLRAARQRARSARRLGIEV